MYRFQNIYYSRKYRPAINHILDIEKQKYKKNRVIIRNFSYSNPGGPPKYPIPYMMLVLLPVIVSINNYFRKSK
jgi:hypothetical protein